MKSLTALSCGLMIACLALAPSAGAATYVLSPTDDVIVTVLDPDTNFGSSPALGTNLAFLNQRSFTFMKFDLGEIPATEAISGAALNLFQINGAGFGESGVSLFRIDNDDWDEGTATWNNPPAPASAGTFLFLNPNGQFYRGYASWDLLDNGAWDTAVDRADGFLSLLLAQASSNDQARNWCSKESTIDTCSFEGETGLPFLEITTTVIPLPAALPIFGGALAWLLGFAARRRSTVYR